MPQSRLNKSLKRITADSSVRRAFFVFTLTRILVLAILLIGGQMSRVVNGDSDTLRDMSLSLGKIPVGRIFVLFDDGAVRSPLFDGFGVKAKSESRGQRTEVREEIKGISPTCIV